VETVLVGGEMQGEVCLENSYHFGKNDGAADTAAKLAFDAARPGLEDFENYRQLLNIHLRSLYM
jgi:hypothetical protein